MSKRILITGGAGFIGSHLADELLQCGHEVRVLDSLVQQVHGATSDRPPYLSADVEFIRGDIRSLRLLRTALRGVDAVFHLAAAVGVGQSMYQVANYTRLNNLGTAILMQALIRKPVERLVVASSMSIYGEGLYTDSRGQIRPGKLRSLDQLREKRWEVQGDNGDHLQPIATPESKTPDLTSIYALSKYDQEKMCLILGNAYGIPTVALRFFNVFGSRQALSNPYTGVLAIFGSRYLNNKPPLIYEDGLQKRDFVSVSDVVQACRLAMEQPNVANEVFNIGSGRSYTIRKVATLMGKAMGKEHIAPTITQSFRSGDVRHCFADITKARQTLGYRPRHALESGIKELVDWIQGQVAFDHVGHAHAELAIRGLAV